MKRPARIASTRTAVIAFAVVEALVLAWALLAGRPRTTAAHRAPPASTRSPR